MSGLCVKRRKDWAKIERVISFLNQHYKALLHGNLYGCSWQALIDHSRLHGRQSSRKLQALLSHRRPFLSTGLQQLETDFRGPDTGVQWTQTARTHMRVVKQEGGDYMSNNGMSYGKATAALTDKW